MAKLGTKKNPIIARVQTMERAEEIISICERNKWIFTIGLEPDQPEDISDVLKLLNKKQPDSQPATVVPRYSRNDYCPCGSGEKYKNCCWDQDHPGSEA
ncbi:MAG: SEC-C domain-containing protein [Deltaproteobacteria bacterium]|nr:SEC-C domain-containing protein [Deltaproteobacteria bacterium]